MANVNDSIPSACDKCSKDFNRPRDPLVPAEPRSESESVCDECKKISSAGTSYVLTNSAESSGTHCFGEVEISPASIVRSFGPGSEGDGFKVSRQWVFRHGDLIFTLYDWKSTDLYERGMWTPDEMWASPWPFDLHVGSKDPATEKDVAEFIDFLQRTSSVARPPETRNRDFRPAWCECPDGLPDSIYMPDKACTCGVDKHHYHCITCRGISQVG